MEPVPESDRIPPVQRFAKASIGFDLNRELDKLVHEDHSGTAGHRQVALYKQGNATIALFRFDVGGFLPEHKAPGTVFIQCLEGQIDVKVGEEAHSLRRSGLLVLSPGVVHDVRAREPSTMLLTVCLEEK